MPTEKVNIVCTPHPPPPFCWGELSLLPNFWGSVDEKRIYRRELPKKRGVGQFADLRGRGLDEKEGVVFLSWGGGDQFPCRKEESKKKVSIKQPHVFSTFLLLQEIIY